MSTGAYHPVVADSWASTSATRKSMQANRSRDTAPELALRRAVHALGLRYRVCARPIPEVRRTADMVFTRAKVCVELRGCYWHGCEQHHRLPKANQGYWQEKLEKNRRRDAALEDILAAAGWTLIVVWEHEDPHGAALRVEQVVRSKRMGTDRRRRAMSTDVPEAATSSGTSERMNAAPKGADL
ncbi:very short patch repair endonuclease [Planotetraspora sp. A-T 1434]|uniref:very short patch repair endonuclease n=1 Tax=Planotetraspora sp. A-T 1434 TaxID=2979219 RepID=UPI0028FC2639|nr:very short patch repair endonuclease [Planotetraspora sp. A-T 1434]